MSLFMDIHQYTHITRICDKILTKIFQCGDIEIMLRGRKVSRVNFTNASQTNTKSIENRYAFHENTNMTNITSYYVQTPLKIS